MARIAVIVLNINGMRFTDYVSLRRQDFRESTPVIGIKSATRQMFDLVVEPLECCSITIAEHPGHSFPCTTINGLDDPKLVFFEPTKCHISSNSICVMSPGTSGSGMLSPNDRIQRYTSV
jgi:hypothetical protein